MSLEQTIKDTIVSESYDLDGRLQQLVRAGLMPANTIPVLRKAIAKVQGGMTLQGAERDVMANFINSMMFIVLGDDAIFNRARAGAKTYATEAKEKTEYDYEGDMAMGQLKSIIANSQRMHDMLSDDTNLPEWVQSKITLAEDYISTASNYMQGEMNEEQINELSKKTMGSYVKKASGAEQPKNVMSPKNVPLTKIASYQGDSETGYFGKRFNQHTYDKAERLRKNRETGIKRAVDKLTKEEVEQVDEVSKKTLGRYINKAKDSIDMTSYRSGIKDGTAISSSTPYKSNNPLEKKLSKRHKGIETAVKKLTKEDIDAVKKMNESYKTAFQTALNEYGIKSPSELDESKRKEFFNHVDLEFKKGDN